MDEERKLPWELDGVLPELPWDPGAGDWYLVFKIEEELPAPNSGGL